MKGQYLAVETVFTFGLGLLVAVGMITLFNQYKVEVISSAEPHQVEVIQSEILLSMNTLRQVDVQGKNGSGRLVVDLPSRLAGKSYSVELDRGIVVNVDQESNRMNLTGFRSYNLEGSAEGGDITIFKRGNNFTLRAR